MKYLFLTLLFLSQVSAQNSRPSLTEFSNEVNKSLPEVYDSVTKLMKTTVENNNFKYNFIIDADQKEYAFAMPKVREQILKTICSKRTEKTILKSYRAHIIYSYENVKGQSLGEFMVRPDYCK